MRAIREARNLFQEQQELLCRKAVDMVLAETKQVEVADLLGIARNSVGHRVKWFKLGGQKAITKRKHGKSV